MTKRKKQKPSEEEKRAKCRNWPVGLKMYPCRRREMVQAHLSVQQAREDGLEQEAAWQEARWKTK